MPHANEAEIMELLLRYLAVPGDTGTAQENNACGFFRDCLAAEPYFRDNPGQLGAWAIPADGLGRAINWALVRGSGPDTVVMIHHSDTVGTEDYGRLAPWARNPAALAGALGAHGVSLGPEAAADLASGTFLFGHGAADMKAGGAIQLALLKRFSRQSRPRGNLLLLALPDEESLSLGMRHAPALLESLKHRYGLDYRLMINSEPHQRTDPAVGVLSEGSVGKILPFVYVRGALAHAGQVFSGLNPVNLLSEVVRRIELDAGWCERSGGEVTVPPTCLFMKDSKERYDVSLPRSAFACFNLLTLERAPATVLERLEQVCRDAAGAVLAGMDRNHAHYRELRGEAAAPLPWSVKVLRFDQLPVPDPAWPSGQGTLVQATWDAAEAQLDQTGISGPVMVIGFVPPYYPSVTNAGFGAPGHPAMALAAHLIQFAAEHLGQRYARENYYTGICDLSYSSLQHGGQLEETLVANMPLHGPAYTIPFRLIRQNAMPCINIGPWGKDFHQLTERVHREDLLEAAPRLIQEAIRCILAP